MLKKIQVSLQGTKRVQGPDVEYMDPVDITLEVDEERKGIIKFTTNRKDIYVNVDDILSALTVIGIIK